MLQDFDFNKVHVAQTADIIQGILNLNHLISEAADGLDEVRYFSNLIEERLQAMTRLLVETHNQELRAGHIWKC